ncbi:MAG TPA: hypothetical protein VN698_16585 [Bacteroidia bacterium]|nr:hypothetical protein [Bacteroidia bacterium]
MSTLTLTQPNTKATQHMKQTIIIDGNNFSNLEGFYAEISKAFNKPADWDLSKSLYAFNDILSGGIGAHAYKETIKLIWINSEKSQADLDFPSMLKFTDHEHFANSEIVLPQPKKIEPLFNVLVSIIQTHKHIELVLA